MSNFSKEYILTTIIKKVKIEVDELFCGDIHAVVSELELRLETKSHPERIENITGEDLETAANVYAYFISCPNDWQAWFDFFNDLLKSEKLGHILLTLNRLLKADNDKIIHRKYIKAAVRKIIEKITSLISLKHRQIPNRAQGNN